MLNYFLITPVLLLFWLQPARPDPVRFVQKDQQIEVYAGDRHMTTYWYDSLLSKPVLYPMFSPSGLPMTRDYPFQEVEGESHDHPHHTGLSFTYGSNGEVNGNSFWANPHDRNPLGQGVRLPQIRHISLVNLKATSDEASISVLNHWVGKNGEPVVAEERKMTFSADDQAYYIDFTITLSPLDEPVTFEDTKEGMFAIRVADWLAESANGTLEESTGIYTNPDGLQTEKNIWGKPSAWMNLEGEKNGRRAGISILHHPSSLNYPTYWHARGYGCFAANPIGRYDYETGRGLENPRTRQLTLKPGEKALFRFRVIVYEGPKSMQQMKRDFADYRD